MSVELKKFNMKMIPQSSVVVMIGKRDTGKSFLTRDLLYNHRHIPAGMVISGTESANSFYGTHVPKVLIHNEYTPQLIANVIRRQKLMMKKVNQEMQESGQQRTDPRAFLILDDCLYDNTWIKDKNIRACFMNGRHYKLLFIITMQYALGVPPNLRTNIDYVFILRENYISNRKRLYEHYAGMFPTFDMFCQVMDQCTENYECLVIHNNAKSNKLEDQVYWYKADSHSAFRIGDPVLWENNALVEDEDDDDYSSVIPKKKSSFYIKKGS